MARRGCARRSLACYMGDRSRGRGRSESPPRPVSPGQPFWYVNMASPPEINMASSDIITEVEIQPDIQEVEIEAIPVEIPCETVETTIEGEDGQPMIALQPLPEPGREEIILQTQEEIVGADPLSVYDQIPVPDNDIYVESSPGPSRKAAKKARKSGGTRFRASDHAIFGEMATETKARKWEQKQVQIKTLEGEFSVTMWASGTDDGESTRPHFRIFSSICFSSLFLFSFYIALPYLDETLLSFSLPLLSASSISLSLFLSLPSYPRTRAGTHFRCDARIDTASLHGRAIASRKDRRPGPLRCPHGPAGLTGRIVCFDRVNAIMFGPTGAAIF